MNLCISKKTLFSLIAGWAFIVFILASFILLQLKYYTVDVTDKGPLLPYQRYDYMTTDSTEYEIEDGIDIVPAYFRTDFASIPKIFWFVDAPYRAEFVYAALWHDYRYACPGKLSRKEIDDIFYSLLIAEKAGTWAAIKMYIAVRLFGEPYYFSEAACDEQIFKEMEDDMTYAEEETDDGRMV